MDSVSARARVRDFDRFKYILNNEVIKINRLNELHQQ